MFEQRTTLPPDPIELAERLHDRAYRSLFWANNGQIAYLCCDPVEHRHELDPEPSLALGERSPLHRVPRWVGLLPYECRRELERRGQGSARAEPHSSEPHWLRYGAVAVIDENGVRVVGESGAHVESLTVHLHGAT